MRKAAFAVLAALLGCGGGGANGVGSQPSWRQASAFEASATTTDAPRAQVPFAPGGTGALYYGLAATTPPATALGDAITAAVVEAATQLGMTPPVADGRLFAAAAALAPHVPDDGVLAYSLVEFALQHHGIIEPSPHLLVIWGNLDEPDEIVGQVTPRLTELLGSGSDTRLGVGAARREGSQGVVVFALQGSRVTIQPVARTVELGRATYLEGRVRSDFRQPQVFVTDPSGGVQRVAVRSISGTDFVAEVPCSLPGRKQVEITAEDLTGSNVLANFPVWCGESPPTSILLDPSSDEPPVVDARDAEQRLLALVNRDRVAARLPELRWHEGAANVARGHSEDMFRTGVVAHVSPTTGSAADRVRAAGLRTPTVLENVARAYGIHEAHAGLMGSPGHRANLLSSAATHLGLGVVLGAEVSGQRELLVTQVFIRIPPPIDPSSAASVVLAAAQAVRPLTERADLTGPAQQLANEIARGVPREQAWAEAKRRVEPLSGRYQRIGTVVTAVGDLANLSGDSLIGSYTPDEIGVGVAQGPHPELGEQAIWVVLLLGELR